MLKSMLPFVQPKSQLPLAMLIQYIEFQNTIKMFQNNTDVLSACTITNESERRNAMLQTIRKFCTPKEKETIDNILNIICVLENYESFAG
ncbi:MAG: hypothetical protein IKJ01_09390 [Lachnospiraceae bacterium]|nr:hypothetical protein [Lachnospiraceae bacterium]